MALLGLLLVVGGGPTAALGGEWSTARATPPPQAKDVSQPLGRALLALAAISWRASAMSCSSSLPCALLSRRPRKLSAQDGLGGSHRASLAMVCPSRSNQASEASVQAPKPWRVVYRAHGLPGGPGSAWTRML